ncbi:ATP-binding protein [Deinococcus peraridilitoris]|nr:ATP-binding protein [Deinococcus peraridilitoris]
MLERSDGEEALRLLLGDRLQEVTAALASAKSENEVLRVVLEPALRSLQAVAGAVLLLDREHSMLRLSASSGYEKGGSTIWQDGPLSAELPATHALQWGQALFFEHAEALHHAYPNLEQLTGARGPVASAVVPMLLEGQALGVIVLDFREPHVFTPPERRFLLTLASQCAIAFERLMLARELEERVDERTRELLQEKAELEAILASIPDAVYVASQSGVTRANDSARALLNLPSGDPLPRSVAELSERLRVRDPRSGARLNLNEEPLVRALSGETSSRDLLIRRDATGEDLLLRSTAAPIHVGGAVVGAVCVKTDITNSLQVREVRALNAQLEQRILERTMALEQQSAALDGFVQFARLTAQATDILTLARHAAQVLRAALGEVSVAYYQPHDHLWKARTWTDDIPPQALEMIRSGVHMDHASFARAVRERQVVYTERWDAESEGLAESREYGAGALYPYFVGTEPCGMLNLATRRAQAWSTREKEVFESVAQSLGLALERAEQARQLDEQRQTLQKHSEALEVANEELEAFSYSVSHDLRTPVRHIKGFAGLLRRAQQDRLDEKSARYLASIEQAASTMDNLIETLLDFSRTARQPLQVAPVPLEQLVDRTRTALAPDLQGREIEWHLEKLPTVLGDGETLQQVMTNLISNAIKYTRPRRPARIEIRALERPDDWLITVRDNGVGFDSRYQDKLFGVFQRLHDEDDFEGTGVGLANVKRIIARHGGQVGAESQVGQGAAFHFTLPKHPEVSGAVPDESS